MTFASYLMPIVIAFAALAAERTGKLTASAAIVGFAEAFLIWEGTFYSGIALLATFFLLAVCATSVKKGKKLQFNLLESTSGKRRAGQVFANGGVAALLGAAAWAFPAEERVYTLLIASALASATSDTLASELGNVFGRNYYNIISLKPEKRGENGVVSIEGTLAGLAGAGAVAAVFVAGTTAAGIEALIVIVAGTGGNLFDSVLGATLERKGLVKNNMVNFLNTVFAALLAYGLYQLLNPQ